MIEYVRYVPILTTVLSAVLGTILLRRHREKPGRPYLGWWAAGVYIYGLGTLCESTVTLAGWSPAMFRLWYVAGALLGGVSLAQGSVYFHLERRVANRLTVLVVTYLLVASILVAVGPLDLTLVEPHRLSGKVMVWSWVRLFSPPANLYAVIFLIGGAGRSVWQHLRRGSPGRFAVGNTLIAVGAVLPGIGGAYSRMGLTEVLYVLECIGLILIWIGYRLCTVR